MVEFLTELHNTTVLEGEDATFKCVVSLDDVQLVWFMDNEPITLGDRFQATENGLCHTLVIRKCQMLDCSKITAEAEGQISKASLKVQGRMKILGELSFTAPLKIFDLILDLMAEHRGFLQSTADSFQITNSNCAGLLDRKPKEPTQTYCDN